MTWVDPWNDDGWEAAKEARKAVVKAERDRIIAETGLDPVRATYRAILALTAEDEKTVTLDRHSGLPI